MSSREGDDVAGARAVVWSVAGLDPGGAAGLAADTRAAEATGVHLCPVAAALTAQNSVALSAVHAIPPEQLAAQLDALVDDLPPAAIKTGLLGSVANVRVVAQVVDRLRRRGPVALVVDPLGRASTGGELSGADVLAAIRDELLPRATLVTPNRAEAARLAGEAPGAAPGRLARSLAARGAQAVCVTGGDDGGAWSIDRFASSEGRAGRLASPRREAADDRGTGCTFATGAAAALARGFPVDDAVVLAKLLVTSALHPRRRGPGSGPGPVRPEVGFVGDASAMPAWFDEDEDEDVGAAVDAPAAGAVHGLYAIASSGAAAVALFEAGVRLVQLRRKRAPDDGDDAAWTACLLDEIAAALRAARRAGGTLVVNDHWRVAIESGVPWVHLGQEDLDALAPADRNALRAARGRGLRLGVSSHTVRELARARAWTPDYIACGPVWPTTTKAMPWRPQGLDNLRWWVRVAGAPVVAIGGVTSFERLGAAAACGATSVALARALGGATSGDVAAWRLAWEAGRALARDLSPAWPHPAVD